MKSNSRVYEASHWLLIVSAVFFPAAVRLSTCCRLLEGSTVLSMRPARQAASTVLLRVLLSSSSAPASSVTLVCPRRSTSSRRWHCAKVTPQQPGFRGHRQLDLPLQHLEVCSEFADRDFRGGHFPSRDAP